MSDFVLVTTISHFRLNYVIPKTVFEKLGYQEPVDTEKLSNYIHAGNVKEISQAHLGENVVEIREYSKDDMLKKFDELNEYLIEWSTEKKLEFLSDWQEFPDET